jgi:hypothetical protein
MLLALAVVLGLVVAPLAGGRVRRLGDLRLRMPWLLGAALATQVLVLSVFTGPKTWWRVGAYLGSYALIVTFLVANRTMPGFGVITAGVVLNLVAIGANAGVMPASSGAASTAGLPTASGDVFANSAVLAHPRLAFLGDVFAVPASWPLANVFSVGDVLLAVGAFVTVQGATGSRLAARRRTPDDP